jgi:hypothetical protein
VFWPITNCIALHVRRFSWVGRVGVERHDLSNGERHTIAWLGWTAVTVLTRPQPPDGDRREIERLTKSLRMLREQGAPPEVIHDTGMRLLDAFARSKRGAAT